MKRSATLPRRAAIVSVHHWPTDAFDFLQAQVDKLRKEVAQLSERLDALDEAAANAAAVNAPLKRRGVQPRRVKG